MKLCPILILPLIGLTAGLSGCTAGLQAWSYDAGRPSRPVSADDSTSHPAVNALAEPPAFRQPSAATSATNQRAPQSTGVTACRPLDKSGDGKSGHGSAQNHSVRTVSHESGWSTAGSNLRKPADATLTLDGRTYRVELIEAGADDDRQGAVRPASGELTVPPMPGPVPQELSDSALVEEAIPVVPQPANVIQLNLPTAMSMVGGQHPAVGFAQWRVQQAYAQLDSARVLWLPSIQPGFSVHRHDGNLQVGNGTIQDVNRNSLQYGLGAGAVAAGTTPQPGVAARFHLADAIFQPQIAEKTAWARGHAASGVINEQLLNVALAYLELLNAEQDRRIVEETRDRTAELAKLTRDFAETGQGLQADADRLQTELILVKDRLASSRERVEVASARLSQALSIDAGRRIVPLDPTVVPVELVALDADKPSLISTGLSNRPELKEARALVAVACEQYRRQKYAPLVPSLLLGFSTGGFGGGLGGDPDNFDGRYDIDALVTWEVRNLGFGEVAARRETQSRVEQAKFSSVRVMDQVAREIAEAHSQAVHRSERIAITEEAIGSAEDSHERNLRRIRDGQGLPLEVLQSVRALEDAQRAYLQAVIEYNQAQFRLQWALGWPLVAPGETVPHPATT